ncbi:hypothetical protein [Membranihabitans marinus]|uniref:hypothetical protein n=1 Tax=Membranihabitans marinus TaxID=1227546 RepID=UPI001F193F34|nr:hypothetical protein [Membranihabitans marinus]
MENILNNLINTELVSIQADRIRIHKFYNNSTSFNFNKGCHLNLKHKNNSLSIFVNWTILELGTDDESFELTIKSTSKKDKSDTIQYSGEIFPNSNIDHTIAQIEVFSIENLENNASSEGAFLFRNRDYKKIALLYFYWPFEGGSIAFDEKHIDAYFNYNIYGKSCKIQSVIK